MMGLQRFGFLSGIPAEEVEALGYLAAFQTETSGN